MYEKHAKIAFQFDVNYCALLYELYDVVLIVFSRAHPHDVKVETKISELD